MNAPLTGYGSLAYLTCAVIGLLASAAPARADQLVCGWVDQARAADGSTAGRGRTSSSVTAYQSPCQHRARKEEEEAPEEGSPDEEHDWLRAQLLACCLLMIPPFNFVPPAPLIVKPPPQAPPPQKPPGGPPIPPPLTAVPEPASALTALLGAGLAGASALWRRRRARQAKRKEAVPELLGAAPS
jgi:PEP-CTERM motif